MPRVAVSGRVAIPARQNLLAVPNDLTNATWLKVNVTITADADAGPSAAVLAGANLFADVSSLALDALIPAAGAGVTAAIVQQNYATPAGANRKQYTMSCIAKQGPLNNFGVFMSANGGGSGAYFGLASGTLGQVQAGNSASIVALGSGYYQLILVMASQDFGPNANLYCVQADGTATVSNGDGTTVHCYAGGFQVVGGANRAGLLTMTGTPLTPSIRSTP